MTSPTLICFLLLAALPIQAAVNEVHAAQVLETAVLEVPNPQVSTPDETRIASDLNSQYLLVGSLAFVAAPVGNDQADWTTVRSSVRNGEVLEFRVTSVYNADPNGEPQREVDSIVRYQMEEDRWTLLGVQMEGTRNVIPSRPGNGAEPC